MNALPWINVSCLGFDPFAGRARWALTFDSALTLTLRHTLAAILSAILVLSLTALLPQRQTMLWNASGLKVI